MTHHLLLPPIHFGLSANSGLLSHYLGVLATMDTGQDMNLTLLLRQLTIHSPAPTQHTNCKTVRK